MKIICALFLCATLPLAALPQGESSTFGQITINKSDASLEVQQTSDKAIINWDSFSIGQGEKVIFKQPSDDADCLNRVVGTLPSYIDGDLESNGNVFLINENGVTVGASGTIFCGSFLAATLNLSDNDFLRENFNLQGNSDAAIINEGKIVAQNDGNIGFIANHIVNKGKITAEGDGMILLIAAKGVKDRGEELSKVTSSDALIENFGEIRGNEITLIAANDNPEALAINQKGIIEATQFTYDDAPYYWDADFIVHHIVDGDLLINSGEGRAEISGTIKGEDAYISIFGRSIHIPDAIIDTSTNDDNFSEIVIGSGLHAAKISDATPTLSLVIGKDAKIAANCYQDGDGGEIILGSAGELKCDGSISATGGAFDGDGGYVMVYKDLGHTPLAGHVDVSAPNGDEGIVEGIIFTDPLVEPALY